MSSLLWPKVHSSTSYIYPAKAEKKKKKTRNKKTLQDFQRPPEQPSAVTDFVKPLYFSVKKHIFMTLSMLYIFVKKKCISYFHGLI